MSYTVACVSKVVQPYGSWNGPTLCGADGKTECTTEVGFAEAVGAHKLSLQASQTLPAISVCHKAAWPLDIAQRDVLTIPAHTVKQAMCLVPGQ